MRVGPFGFTLGGGFSTPLNDRLGVSDGETCLIVFDLEADEGIGRDPAGREVDLRPFLGVMGMPPFEPGVYPTAPPRISGGNLDCAELVAGTTLLLPIPVDGALFSAGDCHARQGDGEVSQLAIECPAERVELTLELRDEPVLAGPVAWTPQAWIALGLDEDLDEAAALAVDGMLDLMIPRARRRPPGGAGLRERRRRPARDAARQRRPRRPRRPPPRRDPLHENALMAYEFKLPDLGEGLTEGEVARWLVQEGQEIAEDDPLVEVQTDKATVEIPSPAAGKVARILVAEGEVVAVGTVLVVIGDEDGAHREPRRRSRSLPWRTRHLRLRGPRARRFARRRSSAVSPRSSDVDVSTVRRHGPQGRVTEDDVRGRSGVRRAGRTPAAGRAHESVTEGRRIPLRGTRRVIAEHMARAHREVAPVTWVEECDFGNVSLERLVATLLRACALALREFPELNARLEGNEIVELDRYDLGVAVQTEHGLVVPVVRGCDSRTLKELDADVRRLAESARAGKLAPEELRGSTFTVTSAGKLGGLLQTPIVNHPEVAILSVGRIAERPVVRDGAVVARPVGMVAITFDHRVVDGARAAEFGLDVIARLETG